MNGTKPPTVEEMRAQLHEAFHLTEADDDYFGNLAGFKTASWGDDSDLRHIFDTFNQLGIITYWLQVADLDDVTMLDAGITVSRDGRPYAILFDQNIEFQSHETEDEIIQTVIELEFDARLVRERFAEEAASEDPLQLIAKALDLLESGLAEKFSGYWENVDPTARAFFPEAVDKLEKAYGSLVRCMKKEPTV